MVKSRLLKVIGSSESEVNRKIKKVLKGSNSLNVELLVYETGVGIKITVRDRDGEKVNQMIESMEDKIRERLEDDIFGTDEETLEKVVGVLLSMRRKTIAVAESCTGGLISHLLTNVPGSSNYFQGSVVAYSNGVKTKSLQISPGTIEKFGAVSRETVQAMARGIRKISGADLGLAVTGIAGPGGETKKKPVGLVYMALATDNNLSTEEHHFSGKREVIKLKASHMALDMVRRYLLKE